jgi:hypothetical protein
MTMNLTDSILYNTINKVLTTDEWHTVVVGFADGLSFSIEGKYMRKALAKPGVDVEGIDNEKLWYYRLPYVAGEITKGGIVLQFPKVATLL